jgi:hypothetical protein
MTPMEALGQIFTPPPREDDGPRLGLATTEELYRELICRHRMEGGPHDSPGRAMGMNRALVLAEQLGGLSSTDREYRTVGHG